MLYPDMNLQKRTQQNTTRYRTALYLRLSREDGDKTESDSIAKQRTLLEAYTADHPELCIVDEFVDDGYSGSNFERPAFQNLFRELEQGTINCVLVKDLSRFGRNYIEVGRYLERIFPVMRVRLIAVTDNYDSQSAWKTSDALTHKDSVWATLPLEIIGAFRNMIRSFWWNREERPIAKKAFPAC